ncbi:MAG: hypothetical protein A2000_05355 [Ignavibacteria bacterium GWB2_36_8]|nr:MAG: hypothetical protein A2000_05355 [Ignavibacteria bacterium GWB2_36_8]
MLSKFRVLIILMTLTTVTFAQSVITVTDADIAPGATVNWTGNSTYLLDGFVFVEEGAVLNIEAGTVIKGKATPTTGDNASALIISRGAQIFASGTPNKPIIFTSESDDIANPNDLTSADRGLWGGLIILGRADINTTSGVGQIEGIPTTEPRAAYGGGDTPDDAESSGVLRYVSIRHGGAELSPGDEINGLTLGAVGSGTTVEYVEIYSNLDDAVEWFGGTVNTKYLVSAFCGDDGFDFDEGWRGKNQFWFVLQGEDFAGRMAEQDGGTSPEDGLPYAIPQIYNATYIGSGITAFPQGDGSEALIFRDNAGGKYYNSIITEYNGGGGGAGITVEDLESGEDSRARLEGGDLVLSNNIWWNFGDGNDVANIAPQDFVRTHFEANNNQIIDPQINSISRTGDGNLDPRPDPSGPAGSGAVAPTDPFFTTTSYYGAFDPDGLLWIGGWTALSHNRITDIKVDKITAVIPTEYILTQNYPNPFNPATKIDFSLPKDSDVELTVYNILGQQVEVLINGFRNAGTYELTWDASNLPSGVYIYRLETGSNVISKKMMLLK